MIAQILSAIGSVWRTINGRRTRVLEQRMLEAQVEMAEARAIHASTAENLRIGAKATSAIEGVLDTLILSLARQSEQIASIEAACREREAVIDAELAECRSTSAQQAQMIAQQARTIAALLRRLEIDPSDLDTGDLPPPGPSGGRHHVDAVIFLEDANDPDR